MFFAIDMSITIIPSAVGFYSSRVSSLDLVGKVFTQTVKFCEWT